MRPGPDGVPVHPGEGYTRKEPQAGQEPREVDLADFKKQQLDFQFIEPYLGDMSGTPGSPEPERDEGRAWLDHLSEEDFGFLKRFVLSSGSLKETAETYGVSYPTVRIRLDRLIQKIQALEDEKTRSEFERVLRAQYADGRLDLPTVKILLAAHRRELGRKA
jgi:hypothetical protein